MINYLNYKTLKSIITLFWFWHFYSYLISIPICHPVKGTKNESPYQHGFVAGKRDAKTNLYNACNDYNTINNTAAQAFECLKGSADGNTSRYHAGYLL